MASTYSKKLRLRIGCLSLLVAFSVFLAITIYPYRAWTFGAGLGTLAFVSIFLRVGWFVPLTIAGFCFGMFVLDPPIKGGTIESQMHETLTCILVGTIGGFITGAAIDYYKSCPPTMCGR